MKLFLTIKPSTKLQMTLVLNINRKLKQLTSTHYFAFTKEQDEILRQSGISDSSSHRFDLC